MIDTIKGTITYLTAALAILGSMAIAYLAWSSAVPEDGGRDIAILFGFLGLIVGSAVTFMFNSESATRASRAAQSSAQQGAEQASTQLAPLYTAEVGSTPEPLPPIR